MHHILFVYFFAVLHDYVMKKMPNFVFYREGKQATTKFYFFFLNLDMVPRKSTPVGFTNICHSKWVAIIVIKM